MRTSETKELSDWVMLNLHYLSFWVLTTKEILEYNDWDIKSIEKRTFDLLKWTADRWDNISIDGYMNVK